jgi:hypothetical protein
MNMTAVNGITEIKNFVEYMKGDETVKDNELFVAILDRISFGLKILRATLRDDDNDD